MTPSIKVVRDDIFKQRVDAIVNPANKHMLHGGGLAGIISRRAGERLDKESAYQAPVGTGQAILTTAGDLPFRAVIHAVGPVWGEAEPEESDRLLAQAHRQAIFLAADHRLASVAFPAVSCGIFHYPVGRAAPVAMKAVREAMEASGRYPEQVVFVLPEKSHYREFRRALKGRWWRVWR